jgi:hypothetical protein
MGLGHVAARQELREMMAALQLPELGAAVGEHLAIDDALAQPRNHPEADPARQVGQRVRHSPHGRNCAR